MGYRFSDRPPVKPEDMLPRVAMRNGTTMILALPCMYYEIDKPFHYHDHKLHDHVGWPEPKHPDHVCQMVPPGLPPVPDPCRVFNYVDMDKVTPINLIAEGYDNVYVYFDDDTNVTGITWGSMIDTDEPWVIKLNFKADIQAFKDKPIDYNFTVVAHAPAATIDGKSYPEVYEEVARLTLSVLPGNKQIVE